MSLEATRREQAATFAHDVNALGAITSDAKWLDMPEAKPIGLAQWRTTITVATMLTAQLEHVAWPVPGADPDGFTWLTWTSGETRRFALEIRDTLVGKKYRWTATRDGGEQVRDSDKLRDVVAALRATFPKSMILRVA